MYRNTLQSASMVNLRGFLHKRPDGVAWIRGSDQYPDINGRVWFYQAENGVLVAAELQGLPISDGLSHTPVFGFHIHEGGLCTGNESDPFADVGNHYNPEQIAHPYHAGDLPPLFGNGGYALSVFLTDRVTVREILGRTVIIHSMPDDFHTQPSGNSGTKMACGEIKTWNYN